MIYQTKNYPWYISALQSLGSLFLKEAKEAIDLKREKPSIPEFSKSILDINPQFKGVYKEYYDNGKLKISAKFKSGLLNGELKTYHENGRKKSVTHYVEGKAIGEHQTWYVHGTRDVIAFCKDGYFHGQYKEHNLGGVLRIIAEYNNGIRNPYFLIANDPNSSDHPSRRNTETSNGSEKIISSN